MTQASGDGERDADFAECQARMATLTRCEREVLDGLVAGKTNKVIASDLDVSPRAVEIYRANLMVKMQVDSLPALVRAALAAGIG